MNTAGALSIPLLLVSRISVFLLISARRFKLGDFGLAIDTGLERSKSRVGTLDYMSPEVSHPHTNHAGCARP